MHCVSEVVWPACAHSALPPHLDTSRRPKDSEREGQGYSFVSRGEMEADIRAGRYLEHGEYEGNLYGTRIDSIQGVVATGKVCVLDVNPQVPSGLLLPRLLTEPHDLLSCPPLVTPDTPPVPRTCVGIFSPPASSSAGSEGAEDS